MNRKEEIRRIWSECFNDSPEYVSMYFDRVYRDCDAMTLERDSKIVSSLLLQQYMMKFHGSEVPVGYIAGAATRRNLRGRGYMSELMLKSLEASARRGDLFCFLIPAHEWLYFYYDRFGFSTVSYVDPQRFTSLHTFVYEEHGDTDGYTPVSDPYGDEVYAAFNRLENKRDCTILHSRRDFLNILDDLHMDDGTFVCLRRNSDRIVSMCWANVADDMVKVREILADDDRAEAAALRALRTRYPDKPFLVLSPALDNHRKLYSRGMARIVNVGKTLDAIAASRPEFKSAIRVHDPLLHDNSHTYLMARGKCSINDSYSGRLDLDIDNRVLTDIIFSSPAIGDIVGFPSQRPHMSLMLD